MTIKNQIVFLNNSLNEYYTLFRLIKHILLWQLWRRVISSFLITMTDFLMNSINNQAKLEMIQPKNEPNINHVLSMVYILIHSEEYVGTLFTK